MGTSLFIEEPPLQVLPSLAIAIGLNEAIVLQQFHYLGRIGGRIINGENWVFDTYESLREKFFPFWSEKTIQRVVTTLEENGWLLSCQPEGVMSRRKYYRISNQARLHLTKERLAETNKSRTSDFVHIDETKAGVPLTEIPKPENTEHRNTGQPSVGCASFTDSKPKQGKSAIPLWADVEAHAKREGINLRAALRFFKVSEFNGWTTKTGPIRCWKRAIVGFIEAEPANAQKMESPNQAEFKKWAYATFDEDDLDQVRAFAALYDKRGGMKRNRITGEMEPIGDIKAACLAFVHECNDRNIIR